ncbi:hypothetical protein BCR42DRAFT_430596 [Absidia repens]|uniref:Uncharacterized protein n=1 Tax=Absidia repens TaxID=90262 RepID=A0A1X2HBD6_9FUNG|nr:hypothetical protein BCR42DRAFT_430596 [Absidia repens]
MTDNNLFQLAKVISDLSPKPSPTLPTLDHEYDRRTLPLRKNACAVCAVCFTCSKNYSVDCTCDESQPRRGKNLPQGGLDSRAKKLNRTDKEDHGFTIQWLEENAHKIYRDAASNQVVGLANQTEVGLCKAHSSTLYRAKKRWEQKNHSFSSSSSSPSPSCVLIDAPMPTAAATPTATTTPTASTTRATTSPTTGFKKLESGGLAAKVKELCQQEQHQQQSLSPIATSLNSLSSSLQQQLHLSSGASPKYYPHHHHTTTPPPSASSSSYNLRPYQLHNTSSSSSSSPSTIPLSSSTQYPPALGIPPSPPTPSIQIETVSLKSMPSDEPCIYFIRNLAITDSFTFRHLLDETDIIGTTPPPSGKRIIIADPSSERIFPLSQAIRSVLPRPSSSHMEFCLSLADKTSIDWSSCT